MKSKWFFNRDVALTLMPFMTIGLTMILYASVSFPLLMILVWFCYIANLFFLNAVWSATFDNHHSLQGDSFKKLEGQVQELRELYLDWGVAVTSELFKGRILHTEHIENPKKAVDDLINWHRQDAIREYNEGNNHE